MKGRMRKYRSEVADKEIAEKIQEAEEDIKQGRVKKWKDAEKTIFKDVK